MTLLELAAKVEAAEGPDRELDTLIHFRVHPKWAGRVPSWPPTKISRPAMESGLAMHIEGDGYLYGDDVPRYTESLDAAQTLVPDQHDWSLHCDNGQAIAGCSPADPEGCSWSNCPAATPALALTAASLRARSENPA